MTTEPPPTSTTPKPSVVPTLLLPGMTSARLSLHKLLREAHEDAAAARLAEIEKRKANAIPLDDSTLWSAVNVTAAVVVEAAKGKDGATLRQAAVSLLEQTAEPLGPLPAYETDHRLDGVDVVCRTLSARALSALRAKSIAASHAHRAADGDPVAQDAANGMALDAMGELVAATIVEVHGLRVVGGTGDVIKGLSVAHLAGLERAGLLAAFFDAANHFQGLPAGKLELSGSPAPSI